MALDNRKDLKADTDKGAVKTKYKMNEVRFVRTKRREFRGKSPNKHIG